jgi:hypothetical protein
VHNDRAKPDSQDNHAERQFEWAQSASHMATNPLGAPAGQAHRLDFDTSPHLGGSLSLRLGDADHSDPMIRKCRLERSGLLQNAPIGADIGM